MVAIENVEGGFAPGDICYRFDCKGVIEREDSSLSCQCATSPPPCWVCTSAPTMCPTCGWNSDEDEIDPQSPFRVRYDEIWNNTKEEKEDNDELFW